MAWILSLECDNVATWFLSGSSKRRVHFLTGFSFSYRFPSTSSTMLDCTVSLNNKIVDFIDWTKPRLLSTILIGSFPRIYEKLKYFSVNEKGGVRPSEQ